MPTSCITTDRVRTPNGVVWTLRHVGLDGDGRYAPEHVENPPRLAMERGSRLLSEFGGRPLKGPTAPGLSVRTDAMWSRAVLRVDAIQTRALREMAATWNEAGGEDDIVSAMSVLADTVAGDTTVEEEDAAVEAVAGAAILQDAEVELTLDQARRLRAELDAAIARMERRDTTGIEAGTGAVAA